MKIIEIKKKLSYWFLMFALLCLSGNPLFSFESKITAQAFGFILMLAIIGKGDNSRQIFPYMMFFLGIFLVQAMIIPNFSITSTGFVVMKMMIGVSFAYILGKKFMNSYIDVMWFLAIVSIVGFALTLTIGLLPVIPCGKEGISQVVYTQLFGSVLLNRNAGMFWEPGAFLDI